MHTRIAALTAAAMAVAACLALPANASTPTGCKKAIAYATAKFFKKQHVVLEECVVAGRKAGSPPATALADCRDAASTSATLQHAVQRLNRYIGDACGGRDGVCGGNTTHEVSPADIGWPQTCPNFANGTCTMPIFTCGDIANCVQCIGERAVGDLITRVAQSMANAAPGTAENQCQIGVARATTAEVSKMTRGDLSCWLDVIGGEPGFSAPCPQGDASGDAAAYFDKARAAATRQICQTCGGLSDSNGDGHCDRAPGLDPQAEIGFGAACPSLTAPSGEDCGAVGPVDSLDKYIACVGCLTSYALECTQYSGVLASTTYPPQCNPGNFITLSGGVTVGKDLQSSTAGTLNVPAPAGNLAVTITSADPSRLLLATSPTSAGSASIIVQVGAGTTAIPAFYVQALADSGSVAVTASASTYAPGTTNVDLARSGFVFSNNYYCGNNFAGGDFTTTTYSAPTGLGVRVARLDSNGQPVPDGQLRPGASASVELTSSDTGVGTITGSPLVLNGGETYNCGGGFVPGSLGSSTLTVGTPSGFATPASGVALIATVRAPTITLSDVTVGHSLQVGTTVSLEVAPPSPVTVTVTSSDGSTVSVSDSTTTDGGASIDFNGVSGTQVQLYVQGRELGSATLSVSAPGYTGSGATATVGPSGFVFYPYHAYYCGACGCSYCAENFSTVSNSTDSPLGINAALLDSNFAFVAIQALRPGVGPVNVPITSSDEGVGTIVGSPAVFNDGDSGNVATAFDPVAPGMTEVTIGVPSGFDTPSSGRTIAVTVDAPPPPTLSFSSADVHVGEDLQTAVNVNLNVAPGSPVDVTISVADPSIAVITDAASSVGGSTVTFSGVTSTFAGTVYIQGLDQTLGTTMLTAQAAGYVDATTTVTVDPSGFVYATSYYCYGCSCGYCVSDFSVDSDQPNRSLGINSVRLAPAVFSPAEYQALRPGVAPVNVQVSSSDEAVGTIVGNPAVFNGGEGGNTSLAFAPIAPTSTVLTIEVPSGFDTPGSGRQLTATVSDPPPPPAPTSTFSSTDIRVGRNLQVPVSLTLSPAPTSPVSVTLTSGDGTKVTLVDAASATSAGTATLALTNVTSGTITFYVQGLQATLGGVSLNATITGGYPTPAAAAVNVEEAGFVFAHNGFSTSAGAGDVALTIRPVRLHPTYLTVQQVCPYYCYIDYQDVRGGLTNVQVPVTVSGDPTGTIVGSPAVFNGGGGGVNTSTAFHPVQMGSSQLTLAVPANFSPPSDSPDPNAYPRRSISVTVSP